jgi:alkylation response protein AidB-like acyl-CoA dehydrogenase
MNFATHRTTSHRLRTWYAISRIKTSRPKMMEWDESQEFPVEVFRKLGELGLMGVLIPTELWWLRNDVISNT